MKTNITIKGKFKRKPLGAINEKIPVPIGWFVIPYRLMPDKNDRRKYHGKWFMIESKHAKIFRVLRFAGELSGTTDNKAKDILMDWVGWINLCDRDEKVDIELDLTITKIGLLKYIIAGLSHPEPSFKLSVVLAILSVVLGLLSVILTIIFFCIN